MHFYYTHIYIYFFSFFFFFKLNNKTTTQHVPFYLAIWNGLIGKVNPCPHLAVALLMWNKYLDSSTWQTHAIK